METARRTLGSGGSSAGTGKKALAGSRGWCCSPVVEQELQRGVGLLRGQVSRGACGWVQEGAASECGLGRHAAAAAAAASLAARQTTSCCCCYTGPLLYSPSTTMDRQISEVKPHTQESRSDTSDSSPSSSSEGGPRAGGACAGAAMASCCCCCWWCWCWCCTWRRVSSPAKDEPGRARGSRQRAAGGRAAAAAARAWSDGRCCCPVAAIARRRACPAYCRGGGSAGEREASKQRSRVQ